jgi:hypothetical protein
MDSRYGIDPPDDGDGRWPGSDLDVSPDCDGCHAPATLTLVEVCGGGIAWLCQDCQRREVRLAARDEHEATKPLQWALPVGVAR